VLPMFFTGQHAIITGGSSGIGLETAKLLARQGATISIIARNPAQMKKAQAEILTDCAPLVPDVSIHSADVSDQGQLNRAIGQAIHLHGPPDILITSAGMAHPGYFRELPIQVFERTMAVNYFGSLYGIKAVLPAMEQRKKGHLVLISSGVGLIGVFGYTPYSPTKFALRGLAESLRGELRTMGILISIVYPPDTNTPQLVMENQLKPPETALINATAQTWNPEDVAREIVRGIGNQTFAITPGLEMTVLSKWHSVLAPVLHWYFDRLVSRFPS
jgi:3-dehydrosphinganine reductase